MKYDFIDNSKKYDNPTLFTHDLSMVGEHALQDIIRSLMSDIPYSTRQWAIDNLFRNSHYGCLLQDVKTLIDMCDDICFYVPTSRKWFHKAYAHEAYRKNRAGSLSRSMTSSKSQNQEENKAETNETATNENSTDQDAPVNLPIDFPYISWRGLDQNIKAIGENDKIRLVSDIDNVYDDEKVRFELMYKDAQGKETIFDSLQASLKNGTAIADWQVNFSKVKTTDFTFHYRPTVRNQSGKYSEIPIRKELFKCDYAPIPHTHFQFESVIPILDEQGSLIDTIVSVFNFISENANKELVIFGHTDTKGEASLNYEYSKWRSISCRALLDNDNESWLDAIEFSSQLSDIQQILKSLTVKYGWNCDPGAIDNKNGPNTTSAVKKFQEEFNQKYTGNLVVDGVIGTKTQSAIFKVLRDIIETAFKSINGEGATIPKIVYGYQGKGIYPCGESFPIDAKGQDEVKSEINRRVEIVFFDKGKAPQLLEPPKNQKVTTKENPVYDETKTKKSKIELKVQPSGKQVLVDDDSDGIILYSPGDDQYFDVNEEDLEFLLKEVRFTSQIMNEINILQKEIASGKDVESSTKKSLDLTKKINDEFKGLTDKPTEAIKELLAVTSNKRWGNLADRVYIRPYMTKNGQVKGHWRNSKDELIKKKLDKWLKKESKDEKEKKKGEERKKKLEGKIKGVIWNSEGIDTQWPWKWKFEIPKDTGVETKAGYFSVSGEAQFFRFVAGARVDAGFDLKERQIKLAAHGDVSYGLADGKLTGTWSLPSKNGYDLFSLLSLSYNAKNVVKDKSELRIRFTIEAKGKAFIGAEVVGAIALPLIDFSKTKPSKKTSSSSSPAMMVQARGDAFAGGSLEGSLAIKAEWSDSVKSKFESLAYIEHCAAGSAGIGAGVKFEIGYKDGSFRIQAGAMVVLGLGGKGTFSYELSVDEGFEFLAHIFYNVEYHTVFSVTSEAFAAFRDYAFAKFVYGANLTKEKALKALNELSNFTHWLKDNIQKNEIGNVKNKIRDNAMEIYLRNAPPETLGGRVLRTIMEVPEESDFDTIIKIVESVKTDHELKWVLRNVQTKIPIRMNMSEKEKGDALQEGIATILEFGNDIESSELYKKRLQTIFNLKGIR